ncbi:contractile injection system protein, VgrG/Pvc8 family [Paenarthrobacter sp. PH39-S1]|uniref:phage late control D family protein n=1 Tax=Paenarthrobacter sp. PH39-S1 TaxID=3046204 RepID=UPI0024BBDEB1|nr:contractile injection system protein, VgrG/Pvc8 family [Paenarthrobacter sp. PH39-S1]MDJ0355298.1 contractile injection system protein, VgrG/Pvc8 family [Paenarthrobacter sp. PH39-S1]
MTDPLLAVVSPVFTVNGELAGSLARDCVRLEVAEGCEGLRTLQAHFVAVGPGATGPPSNMLYLDGQTVDFGKSIEVSLGPSSAQRTVFEGTISCIEAAYPDSEPPRVVVYAEDALMRLRMTRRMRTYKDVTDADIAGQIATEHGLQSEIAAEGPRYDVVQQVNQSDLAFLRERARLLQAEVWCTGRKLHFTSRPRRQGTALTLVQGNELLSVRLRADLAHQRSEVVVTGYDASTRAVIDERAGVDVVEGEAASGLTGPRVLEKALGASVSMRVRETALNAGEATAWAKAEMLRRGRGFVTAVGTTRGSPDMVVGSNLSLQSVGPPFDGTGYYVTWVHHIFEHEHGLRTGFEAERSTVNEVSA